LCYEFATWVGGVSDQHCWKYNLGHRISAWQELYYISLKMNRIFAYKQAWRKPILYTMRKKDDAMGNGVSREGQAEGRWETDS